MKNEIITELWQGIREKTAVERAKLAAIRFRINMKLIGVERGNGQSG